MSEVETTNKGIREEEPDLVDTAVNKVGDLGSKALETGKNVVATQVNTAVDYLVPKLDTMSNAEAQAALTDKAAKVKAVMQDLANDPEVKQLIAETGDAFGQLTEELMNAIEQPVMDMTDRGLNLAKKVALTSGKTLAKTGIDLVMSVIGEVPGLGGVVDLGVTTLVAFNGLARNIMITADNLIKMGTIANKLTGDVLDPVEDSIEVFQGLNQKAENVYNSIESKLEELNREYLGATNPNGSMDTRLAQPTSEDEPDNRLSQPVPPPPAPYVDNRISQEPVVEPQPRTAPVPEPPRTPVPAPVPEPQVPTTTVSRIEKPLTNTSSTRKKTPKASTNKRKKRQRTQKKKKKKSKK